MDDLSALLARNAFLESRLSEMTEILTSLQNGGIVEYPDMPEGMVASPDGGIVRREQ